MIFQTRNKRQVHIRTFDLRSLEEEEIEILCQQLYDFSRHNTFKITPEYLLKRLKNYNILCYAKSGDNIVGFGFADFRKLSLSFFKNLPLIHFGLMIIDNGWRGDRLSRIISRSTVKFVVKKNGYKTYFTGFAVSAKCSSPVSFYRLQQASLKLGFPKFNTQGDLNYVSKTFMGRKLSQCIAKALELGDIQDFILKDTNVDSGFMLSQEDYVTNSPYEKKVLNFFNKNVIPHNEVLFMTYAHPIFVL